MDHHGSLLVVAIMATKSFEGKKNIGTEINTFHNSRYTVNSLVFSLYEFYSINLPLISVFPVNDLDPLYFDLSYHSIHNKCHNK